jgi:hypothetical protein
VLAEYEKIGLIAPMCVDRVRVAPTTLGDGTDETTVIVPDLFGGL